MINDLRRTTLFLVDPVEYIDANNTGQSASAKIRKRDSSLRQAATNAFHTDKQEHQENVREFVTVAEDSHCGFKRQRD